MRYVLTMEISCVYDVGKAYMVGKDDTSYALQIFRIE